MYASDLTQMFELSSPAPCLAVGGGLALALLGRRPGRGAQRHWLGQGHRHGR